MNILNSIFTYYDKTIVNFDPFWQAIISLLLLGFLIWQIFMVIKSGQWIFLALLILLLPGTWPAAKMVGNYLLTIAQFLLTRAQVSL